MVSKRKTVRAALVLVNVLAAFACFSLWYHVEFVSRSFQHRFGGLTSRRQGLQIGTATTKRKHKAARHQEKSKRTGHTPRKLVPKSTREHVDSILLPTADNTSALQEVNTSACQDMCSERMCAIIKRSTFHSPCCEAKNLSHAANGTWPLLVTATPRSGTVATTTLLQAAGLKVKSDWHGAGEDGMVSWIHAFSELDVVSKPSNSHRFLYLSPGQLRGARFHAVLHLIRHPLPSITSIGCTEPVTRSRWSNFVSRHIALPPDLVSRRRRLAIAMTLWLEWHRFLDSLCAPRLRLEDLFHPARALATLSDLFSRLRRPPPAPALVHAALAAASNSSNARRHRAVLSWSELIQADPRLARHIHALAVTYGYDADVDMAALEAEVHRRYPNKKKRPRPSCGPATARAKPAPSSRSTGQQFPGRRVTLPGTGTGKAASLVRNATRAQRRPWYAGLPRPRGGVQAGPGESGSHGVQVEADTWKERRKRPWLFRDR